MKILLGIKKRYILVFGALSISLCVSSFSVFAVESVDAWEMQKRIGRGINAKLQIGGEPSFTAPFDAEPNRFKHLKDAGFTSVRLWAFADDHAGAGPDYRLSDEFWREMDKIIQAALDEDLVAVLVLAERGFMNDPLWKIKQKVKAYWTQMGRRYANYPANLVFEVLNEPRENLTTDAWFEFSEEIIKHIRKTNPNRNLLVGGGGTNKPWHLIHRTWLPDSKDDNHIIAIFHRYNPLSYTHQGFSEKSRLILWEDTPRNRHEIIVEGPGTPNENWGLDALEQWSKQKNIPLVCTEFGALAYHKDGTVLPDRNRAVYARSMKEELEKRNMAWMYFTGSKGRWEIYNAGRWTAPLTLDALHEGDSPFVPNPNPTPTPQKKQTTISFDSRAPDIDGNIDDLYPSQWNALDRWPRGEQNRSPVARWTASHDNNRLYLIVDIEDDQLSRDSGDKWYHDDAVEIFIDGNASANSSVQTDDLQLAYRWGDQNLREIHHRRVRGVNVASIETENGWRVEWSIPLALAPIEPLFGIDVMVNDDDNGGNRESKSSWSASTDDAWKNPSVIGVAQLGSDNGPDELSGTLRGTQRSEYHIVSKMYGKFMYASGHNGNAAITRNPTRNAQWRLKDDDGDGRFHLLNVATGQRLRASGSGSFKNVDVRSGSNRESRWLLRDNDADGYYEIVNDRYGTRADADNNDNIDTNTDYGDDVLWQLIRIDN